MRLLITGHNGFKGTWLSKALLKLGHEVHGLSLAPETKSFFYESGLLNGLKTDTNFTILDKEKLTNLIQSIRPEFIIHLAAQPIVKMGYENPLETFEVNVNGTLNVIDTARSVNSIKGILIITSDKVYRNKNLETSYSEGDELGGKDPYSASKSMADILTQSYLNMNLNFPISIARAGNVIGAGDYSPYRLVPDIYRALRDSKSLLIRYPNATRPWQHVLDCISGYLKLMYQTLDKKESYILNFGPESDNIKTVSDLVTQIREESKFELSIDLVEKNIFKEDPYLTLNSEKAQKILNWKNKYNFQQAVSETWSWYEALLTGQNPTHIFENQVENLIKDF